MKKVVLWIFFSFTSLNILFSQNKIDDILEVRGLAIEAPSPANTDCFVDFIEKELAPSLFNLLILRIDYNYQYTSYPELSDKNPLSREDMLKIKRACEESGITVVPQVNLLGHQSWAENTLNLLREYPQFDETPEIIMPERYIWPNEEGLYCKSYCPLHPDVHQVVFALVDELLDLFETDVFHAGMDEVFFIGSDNCPRCAGHDKAELFAGEVVKISEHLDRRGARLMIWGDRLIDGEATGLGMWESSLNNTHKAIDLIPKNVIICDWHYERAELTPVMFALKGFDVITSPWNKKEVTQNHLSNLLLFKDSSSPEIASRFKGIIQTIWSGNSQFLKEYYYNDHTSGEIESLKFLMDQLKLLNHYD